MDKNLIIAGVIFLAIIFLYWKLTNEYGKKTYGKKLWKQWSTRTYYWEGAVMISSGLTVAILFLLRWGNVLTF